MQGPVIAVVGPSGVGKDSVLQALCQRDPGLRLLRRVITRPTGQGEDNVVVSEDQFARMQAEGAFALTWRAHGLSYGVPAEIDAMRTGARGVLVNLSRTVLEAAQDRFGDLVVLSLRADPQVLAARLASRGREDAVDQARRLQRAGSPVSERLQQVIEIDNSGPLEQTVDAVLARLQPQSV